MEIDLRSTPLRIEVWEDRIPLKSENGKYVEEFDIVGPTHSVTKEITYVIPPGYKREESFRGEVSPVKRILKKTLREGDVHWKTQEPNDGTVVASGWAEAGLRVHFKLSHFYATKL